MERESEYYRKYAELERKYSQLEDRFNKLFYKSPQMIAISTLQEGRMIDLNEASASLGGFSREELIGTVEADRGLWADPKQRDMVVQKLKKEGRIHNLVVDLLSRNGSIHTVLFSADPITVDDEPCLMSVSVDLTALGEKVDAVRESEEKYRVLVENSLQGLSIVQGDRLVFCNQALADMLGYTTKELLDISPDALLPLVHPDDRERIEKQFRERLAGLPVPERTEFRMYNKDGKELWLETYSSRIDYNGRQATQSAYVDITERKKAEEKLRELTDYLNRIINCLGDPIFVKDRQHRLVIVNDAFCTYTGTPRADLIGKTGEEYMPEAMSKSLWKREELIFQTGRESIGEEVVAVGGTIATIMAKKTVLTDKNGNKQLVGMLRDISSYKQLQAQFLQAQKMEAIGVLAGGVAHDFNNLLSVINGYCEVILGSTALDDSFREDIEEISQAAHRATSLTSQLLAFSRKQILNPETMNMNNVLREMQTMLRRLVPENIDLSMELQPTLGYISADPGQIQQIILNLVVNARDALPQGGTLIVETTDVELDEEYSRGHPTVVPGPHVMLAISDSGIGMDEQTKAHLFEPFFTTKEKGKGTGLGLSTVYGIVKQSNGSIWVYSEPGKGSTFKIYFPMVEYPDNRPAPERRAPSSKVMGTETVLVVEDEAAVRTIICRMLRSKGYQVLDALNGKEAIQTAQRWAGEIHLVITDVVMPGMSGIDLTKELGSRYPGIKVLYISGYTENGITRHGILDSSVAFLQKPFSIDSLTHKVREVLDR